MTINSTDSSIISVALSIEETQLAITGPLKVTVTDNTDPTNIKIAKRSNIFTKVK